ncbi:Cation transporting ATPase, C-terminus, putative, partial [Leishmania lindenbergi]
DNIRKFLQLQLTVNYVSVALTFIGSLMAGGRSSPLTTVQLLWVNLIMDTLAALALATEEPSEECLKRQPVHRKAPLVSRRMHMTIFMAAAYMLGLTLSMQAYGNVLFKAGPLGGIEHSTIVFNVFVLSTLFHMFNCRKLYEEFNVLEGLLSRSPLFIGVITFCFAFQVVAVQTFGDFMKVTSLRSEEWLGCVIVAIGVLFVGFISRLIPVCESSFEKTFDGSMLDEDAKAVLARVDNAVTKAQATTEEYKEGIYLDKARRLRARALWNEARHHHLHVSRIVNAFRRTRVDRLEEGRHFGVM